MKFFDLRVTQVLKILSFSQRAGFLKNADELPVAPGNFFNGGLPRCPVGSKANKRLPEIRPAHCEADETIDPCRSRQPLAHFFVVLATTKNDTTNFVSPGAVRGGHDRFAILATIKSLDFPDI